MAIFLNVWVIAVGTGCYDLCYLESLPVKIVCLLLSQQFIVMHCQSLQLTAKKASKNQIDLPFILCVSSAHKAEFP